MRTLDKGTSAATPRLSAEDADMARVAQRCIMEALDHTHTAAITLATESGQGTTIDLPPASLRLIGKLLGAMSQGGPATVIWDQQELTTVGAANFLNVSRPFVIKDIEAGRLPHRKVGTHRLVTLEDLLAYARKMREQQALALEGMAENARELGLDY